ncbi:hypothetical protein [Dyella sp. GSA-30]|uniref:hypothetical protein n=1 Tax=Dyella sp. GSA-30 TaxID=2994496 RepID=UPI0024914E7B|nr:hypothetical protein [Dyella sp. GSA-30]BDU22198.1 hypothetical protein DYGSA30_36550 [Dyella sp. GSA-30]
MELAVELAGFFAAHAVWSVSEGEVLVPMLAQVDQGGARSMSRLVADRLEDSVEDGKQRLATNSDGSVYAVLVYDGYITLPSGKTDALLLDIRAYRDPVETLTMALPYRNQQSPQGFAVHRPKFLQYQGGGSSDYARWSDAFFRGVDAHQQGAAVWNKASDPSI